MENKEKEIMNNYGRGHAGKVFIRTFENEK